MRGFFCFFCGFAEMAALGAVLSLGLPPLVAVVMLLIPLVLLVMSLVVLGRPKAERMPDAPVYQYPPLERWQPVEQVVRPSVEEYRLREEGWGRSRRYEGRWD